MNPRVMYLKETGLPESAIYGYGIYEQEIKYNGDYVRWLEKKFDAMSTACLYALKLWHQGETIDPDQQEVDDIKDAVNVEDGE